MPAVVVPASASARDLEIGEACRRGLGDTRGRGGGHGPLHRPRDQHREPGRRAAERVPAVLGLQDRRRGGRPHRGRDHARRRSTTATAAAGCGRATAPSTCAAPSPSPATRTSKRSASGSGTTRVQRYAFLLGPRQPRPGSTSRARTAAACPPRCPQSRVGHLSSHAAGIKTSVVQIAVLMSAMLNGGIIFQPQVSGPGGFVARERWRLPPQTVMGGLAEGFLGAVNEGSASNAFDPDVIVAGKTGTCAGLGWFASYAPADRPEVVIVTMVRPGNGHAASAVGGADLPAALQARPPADRLRRRRLAQPSATSSRARPRLPCCAPAPPRPRARRCGSRGGRPRSDGGPGAAAGSRLAARAAELAVHVHRSVLGG